MRNVLAFNASIMEETIANQMKLLKFLETYENKEKDEYAYLKGIPATKENYETVKLIRKHLCREIYEGNYCRWLTRPVIRLKGRGPRKGTSGNSHYLPLWESKTWALYIHNDVQWGRKSL